MGVIMFFDDSLSIVRPLSALPNLSLFRLGLELGCLTLGFCMSKHIIAWMLSFIHQRKTNCFCWSFQCNEQNRTSRQRRSQQSIMCVVILFRHFHGGILSLLHDFHRGRGFPSAHSMVDHLSVRFPMCVGSEIDLGISNVTTESILDTPKDIEETYHHDSLPRCGRLRRFFLLTSFNLFPHDHQFYRICTQGNWALAIEDSVHSNTIIRQYGA